MQAISGVERCHSVVQFDTPVILWLLIVSVGMREIPCSFRVRIRFPLEFRVRAEFWLLCVLLSFWSVFLR